GRGREPVDETLEAIEAHDRAAGTSAFDRDRTAPQIEDSEQRDDAQDGDAADPLQRHGAEGTPVASGRMDQVGGLLVGDADLAGYDAAAVAKLVEQLLL